MVTEKRSLMMTLDESGHAVEVIQRVDLSLGTKPTEYTIKFAGQPHKITRNDIINLKHFFELILDEF